jgi:hypothetical protein
MTDVPYIRKELNMRERDALKLVSKYWSYDEPRLEKDILEVAEACHSLIAKLKNKGILEE